MIIPEFVKQFCMDQLKDKRTFRVDVDTYLDPEYKNFKSKSGLDFGSDMCFHGLDGTVVTLESYISKLMTYGRFFSKIMIDGTLLSNIYPKALPPVETPPTINLNDTGDSHGETTA
jgi:hypothetical protein